MFEGFDRSAIDFLWGIRLNNDKNWYETHKDEYRQNLAKPMKSLCDELFCDFYSEIGYETVSSFKDSKGRTFSSRLPVP